MNVFRVRCLLAAMKAFNANQVAFGRMEVNLEEMTLRVPAAEGAAFSKKEQEGVGQSVDKGILSDCRFGDETRTTLCFTVHKPDKEKQRCVKGGI